ncbi:MAG: restriction endonuclease subunit S [Candidatus Accumulibacter sp.]|jgi:type I restriction enzyme S subunit|nr:restriction endonuclease subunit S [Accumulibacter sp.]
MPENANTPAIRFSGFTDFWGQRKLSEISNKVTEKNISRNYSETLTNSAEHGIISQRDYFDKDISNEENIDGYYVVRSDDFVYNPRISTSAPVGPIKRNKLGRTGVMSPLYYVFRTHDIDPTYLEHFFSGSSWHGFMQLNGDSGARADRFSIKNSVFEEMPLPYPPLDEQPKIGVLFDKIDNLITLHQREHDKTVNFKKAMLERMFPKEGADRPEIRFAGFSEAWEQRKLGQFTKLITKGTTPLDKSGNGSINFVKVENISNGVITPTSKISNEEHEGYLQRSRLKEDDILFSIAGTLGRTAIVNKSILPANTNQALAIIRDYDFNTDFLLTSLSGNVVKEYVRKNPTIGAQPNLSLEQIGNLEIWTPKVAEQRQVGTFFTNLDHLITLHQRELEKLQTKKKSLLDKMFV